MPASSIRFISGTSSLGILMLAFSTAGLCALLLSDDLAALERDLAQRFPGKPTPQRDEGLSPALVDKFHEAPPEGLFLQNQNDSMGDWRSLSARTGYYPVVGVRFGN
jgi:hypothetical protein